MEKVADLVESSSEADKMSAALSDLPESLESFLDEQKEKPSDLGMIDNDILALANQVGDEMDENAIEGTGFTADLSFLEGAETKDASGEEHGLSFLVEGDKMEVANEDLAFLEEQDMSEGSEYDDDSELNEDDSDDDEGGDDESDDDENEGSNDRSDKGEDVEEGVFGQVSFYDEEPDSNLSVEGSKNGEKVKGLKKKKKKLKAKEKSGGSEGVQKPVKRKRKRKRKKGSADEDDEEEPDDKMPKGGPTQMRRRNIRSILSEKDLDKEMLSAQNEELERQKRLMELKKSLLRENAAAGAAAAAKSSTAAGTAVSTDTAATSTTTTTTKMTSASTGTSTVKEKDSQLKSLLQVAEEEAEKEAESKDRKLLDKEVVKAKKETRETSPPSDVITLSSDTDDSDDLDDDDSDEVVMVPSDEEDDDEAEDVNNGGAHIDDTLNMPDPDGRVKVNLGHPADEPDIFLAPQIAQSIKPHQIGGVRFLYGNLVESMERFRTTPGFGCILAHSMGLGKTIQLISFIDIFLRCAGGKRVLCIVPINTLQNWLAEFNYWLPEKEKLDPDDDLTQFRIFPLYIINDSMKTTAARAAVIQKWKDFGGVLVMGYEMFRLLSSKRTAPSKAKSRAKKPAQPEVIDVEEEDKNKSLMIDMHSTLVDPGPDLVMCDEGHRIKNSSAAISQALKNIKTRRRVVLTGYPLQNNLMEYWCMVDFVRPNFLGTKTEFSNMFERPIMNGQCMDSTVQDKKVMRHRSYVLHNLLEGFVQRRGHTVLQLSLPPKMEHVFLVRLSPIQRKIYVEFMNAISESGLCSWANNNPLKAFAVCCKIWNHPDILHEVLTQHIADKDNDLDIETGEGGSGSKKKRAALSKSASSASVASADSAMSMASASNTPAPSTPTTLTPSASTTSLTSMASESSSDKNPITYDWAEPLMKDYMAGVLENSGKFILMNSLLEECLAVGDKVLIFSQSLLTLNKIEEFLGHMKVPRPEFYENWARNKTYFRLDGSTSAQDREKLINQFNDPEGRAWMFLLSTKAGCLGINLVAANRVIVVDASWNPCHDCQAICRVYRFGQIKKTYVYRLITDNTLEKRIYDRQINKQGMSDRIVDDMNPENKLTRKQVENLLDFEDQDFPVLDFSTADGKYSTDDVLVRVLQNNGQWLTKQPFTHESLLIDRKELRLSKREKRLAKEGYARDKRMNITYTRPSYAAYYPQSGGLPNRLPLNSSYAAFRRGPIVRPIASVRPIISSPAQNGGDKIKQFGGQPLRPGVTIHQVITTTEIVLPGTNTGTTAGAPNKITAGQKILVIRTPKGVYIRTNDGKMFAVRSKTGMGLTGETVSGSSATTSTTSTVTLSSTSSNQVFITPNMNMSTASGKKPPIIIVSNKKGIPLSMARGGSIIRTLPYGSANLLSSLKPSILKTGSAKTTDSTTTTSSTSTKSSTDASSSSSSGSKTSFLADLIRDDDDKDEKSEEKKGDGDTPQAKKPVIVLPSLAVRTPRPPSSLNSSTVATTSPGGGTVVIMPTKPVISMGTRRPAKSSKSKKGSAKTATTKDSGTGVDGLPGEDKKKGVSLLAKSPNPPSTSAVSAGDNTQGTTMSDMSTANNLQTSLPQSVTSGMGPLSSTGQMSHGHPPGIGQQQLGGPQQGAGPSSGFPDLNQMWQSNFGLQGNQGGPMPPPISTSGSMPASRGSNSFSMGMMGQDASSHPMMPNQSGGGDNGGGMMGSGAMQGQNNFNNGQPEPSQMGQGFGASGMGNPYMAGSNMGGHFGMPGQSSAGPSYMGGIGSGGYMPPPPPQSSFSQSLPPPMNQGQPQQPNGGMMYGGTQNANLPPFSHHGNQTNSVVPFDSSANSGGGPVQSGLSSGPSGPQQPPFGFGSNLNFGPTPTSTSFMSQPSNTESGFPSSQTGPSSFSQQTPGFGMNNNNTVGGSSYSAPQQQQHQHSQQPPTSLSTSSSSSPHMPPTSSSTYRDSNAAVPSSNDRSCESSPFSLTLLGSDNMNNTASSEAAVTKPSQYQRTKSSSSSKKNKGSSSSSRTSSPATKKGGKSSSTSGNSNLMSQPSASPHLAMSTPPDSNKNLGDIPENRPASSHSSGLSFNLPGILDGNSASTTLGSNMGIGRLDSNDFDSAKIGMGNAMSSGLGSEMGMGGSAFRAHPSSAVNQSLPSSVLPPSQPFRLDGVGGISSHSAPGLGYASSMSAFSSPSALAPPPSGYGNAAFGAYGSYGGGSLPFASPAAAMMSSHPSQGMMGYPQAPLGYPSMSPLMMGGHSGAAPPSMGGSMWPMMPPSVMGGSYGYPGPAPSMTPMGFPTPGLDTPGFGHLGQGPTDP
ncbi:uncharacterized protein LOC101863187 isoform X2 [Aplysia californica]|uniref:Uncharacterized protein LOC101863187 isoform X2 n=1 Tax=Aplysia californica TaxID=6500 RepID=A0ABM1A091_APLCA|nr:uncharacterized protein LOC101863187 isoform X2 [Aplysia californica]